jgi:hypothetical protein
MLVRERAWLDDECRGLALLHFRNGIAYFGYFGYSSRFKL